LHRLEIPLVKEAKRLENNIQSRNTLQWWRTASSAGLRDKQWVWSISVFKFSPCNACIWGGRVASPLPSHL